MSSRWLLIGVALVLSACGSGTGGSTIRSSVDPAAAAEMTVEMTNRMLLLTSDASLCQADELCARTLALDVPPALTAAEALSFTSAPLLADDDPACVAAARDLKAWADVFPSTMDAWSRDVKAGELADGFELFRSQARKWPDLAMVLLACTT